MTCLVGASVFFATDWLNVAAELNSGTVIGNELAVELQRETETLEIRFQGRKLLVYAFASNQFKPYVRELCTLRGDNILRDAPADHLHHHGLMYAIRVNGVNFWEESGQPGHERSVKFISQNRGKSPAGLPQASFTQLIHWIADKDMARADAESCALLEERRTLRLTVDESADEVALEWRGEFEVGARASKVTLTGSDYNGLGLRFPAEFDHVARHQNSEDVAYSATQNRDVIQAKWSIVSHSMNGRAPMIALFADPDRTAGTTRFFSMLNPFAYLSVTQGLDKEPLEYKAGDTFSVAYFVLAYSSAKSNEFVQKRYREWISSSRPSPAPSP